MNPRALLQVRGFGSFRYSTLYESTNDLKRVLAGFGLTPEPLLLIEVDKKVALAIVARLLWKDMVHEIENMSQVDASRMASEIIDEHSTEDCRYYSNRDNGTAPSWNSMTSATFDAGVIIQNQNGLYFCIWFEEED